MKVFFFFFWERIAQAKTTEASRKGISFFWKKKQKQKNKTFLV